MYENKEGSDNYFDYLEANLAFLVFAVDENAKIVFDEEHCIDYFDYLAGNGM